MDIVRCECCGQIIPPPLERCVCGHPMLSHHYSAKGNCLYCTVWTAYHKCPCTKGVPA